VRDILNLGNNFLVFSSVLAFVLENSSLEFRGDGVGDGDVSPVIGIRSFSMVISSTVVLGLAEDCELVLRFEASMYIAHRGPPVNGRLR
jgi:hypothetical protein